MKEKGMGEREGDGGERRNRAICVNIFCYYPDIKLKTGVGLLLINTLVLTKWYWD